MDGADSLETAQRNGDNRLMPMRICAALFLCALEAGAANAREGPVDQRIRPAGPPGQETVRPMAKRRTSARTYGGVVQSAVAGSYIAVGLAGGLGTVVFRPLDSWACDGIEDGEVVALLARPAAPRNTLVPVTTVVPCPVARLR